MPPPIDTSLLPEAGVAGLAVVVLFYAWRGLARVPLLPRLALGLIIGVLVPISFGVVILALSPFGGLARQGTPVAAAAQEQALPQALSEPARAPATLPAAVSPRVAAAPLLAPPAAAPREGAPGAAPPPASEIARVPAGSDSIDVLYGTDRGRVAGSDAVHYSSARAERLEVGRAVVSGGSAGRLAVVSASSGAGSDATGPVAIGTARQPPALSALSREGFTALASSRVGVAKRFPGRAVVFVHGYNTSLETAITDAARAGAAMGLDVPPFVYGWPSASAIASYSYDQTSAAAAVRPLSEFLALVAAIPGVRDVSVIALDMGAEPALRALEQSSALPLKELILVAPDVDAQGFGGRVASLTQRAHLSVFATGRWRALAVSRRFNGGARRAGDIGADGPLTFPGADTIDATSETAPEAGLPALSRAVLADWGTLIETGRMARERRDSGLERILDKSGAGHWRYAH